MPKRPRFECTSEGDSSLDSWQLNEDEENIKRMKIITKELKEPEKQERKMKAMESIKKLLNVSEKYSSIWMKRFDDLKGGVEEDHFGQQLSAESEDLSKMKYFTGTLREYQYEGVQWMRTLCLGGINGILADEMGLGKTVQIIGLLSHFLEKKLMGPHLIVGPLSTIINWKNEFQRFCPKMPVTVFHGTKDEWDGLQKEVMRVHKVDDMKVRPVVITNYDSILKNEKFLQQISWKYIIIDEAQRIKNHNSLLAIALRKFSCMNKILLTGTPLQNNMTELWALLNFIMPKIFNNVDAFASLFVLEDMEDQQIISDRSENNTIISTIHKVLSPFMLRRLKKEVVKDSVPKKEVLIYCPMTETQRKIYKAILMKNVRQIKEVSGVELEEEVPLGKRKLARKTNYAEANSDDEFCIEESDDSQEGQAHKKNLQGYLFKIKLAAPMVMLRKVVNHPYLINVPFIEETKELLIDKKLISESGKLLVLDAMLAKLKEKGHKVLIFCTSVMMLDLIEEYMIMKEHTYNRLDGRDKLAFRQENIDEFNLNPNKFAFLISTRAGGLGINLTGADTVIFYDRDWNPQADSQAQDRCHRIGQTKPVVVYTLVTKNTIDEKVIKTGQMKRRLEKLIIKDGKFRTRASNDNDNLDTLENLLKLLEMCDGSNIVKADEKVLSDEELESLLDRSDLYKEMEMKNKC